VSEFRVNFFRTPESFSGRERLCIGKERKEVDGPVLRVIAGVVAIAWFLSNGQAQLRVKLRRVNCPLYVVRRRASPAYINFEMGLVWMRWIFRYMDDKKMLGLIGF